VFELRRNGAKGESSLAKKMIFFGQ